MDTVLFGGISLYHYDLATGSLTSDSELPFVNDVTSLVRSRNGSFQEYIMPNQIPGNVGPFQMPGETNLYGAEAAFFANPNLAKYADNIINLNAIHGPTILGYIYGGIVANMGNFGSSTATGAVFQVTITSR